MTLEEGDLLLTGSSSHCPTAFELNSLAQERLLVLAQSWMETK